MRLASKLEIDQIAWLLQSLQPHTGWQDEGGFPILVSEGDHRDCVFRVHQIEDKLLVVRFPANLLGKGIS
jgi:hypothetical protein